MNVSVQVAEILKDRPSWFRDCRCLDIMSVITTGSGGTIELIYMQVCTCTLWNMHFLADLWNNSFLPCILIYFLFFHQTYAPTMLAAARDFWTLRYTTTLEDGSLVVSHWCFCFSLFRLHSLVSNCCADMWEVIDIFYWWPNRTSSFNLCKSWYASQWLSNPTMWGWWFHHSHCWSCWLRCKNKL